MSNVVVTGCSTGTGRATAVSLARAGHSVFTAMGNPETPGMPRVRSV